MRLPAYSLPCSPERRAAAAPCRRRPRGGYTLLEIILALSIAALLLAGLYYALYIQTNNTYSGRRLVERANLARAIISRIQNDILSSLGPIDTQISANSKGGGSTSGSSSGTGSTGTGSTGTGSTSGMSGGSSGSTDSSGSTSSDGSSQTSAQTFNLGLQGSSTQLSIYCSRVPREALQALNPNNSGTAPPQGVSDLRRITYWLASSSPGGLARQVTLGVTSQTDIGNMPPNVSDESSSVIHSEVVSVQFQYYDGTSWQDSWDGTQPGADGVTPQGPPVAVAITVTITQPGDRASQQGAQGGQGSQAAQTYQYYHVVGIPTANGAITTANAANAQGTMGSSGTSSSGGN